MADQNYIADEILKLRSDLGELFNLQTTLKTSVVSSINELQGSLAAGVPSTGGGSLTSTTFTKPITTTTEWTNTGISGTDLVSGTYIVQIYANDIFNGGTNNNEYYSGILSWFSGVTEAILEDITDEIPLHRTGSGNDGNLYLRTIRTVNNEVNLQISSNFTMTASSNYVFTFSKIS